MDRMTLVRRAWLSMALRPVGIWVKVGDKHPQIDAEWMGVVRHEDTDSRVGFVLGFYRLDGTWLTHIQRHTIAECLDESVALVGIGRDEWEVVDLEVPPSWATNDLPPEFAPQVPHDV